MRTLHFLVCREFERLLSGKPKPKLHRAEQLANLSGQSSAKNYAGGFGPGVACRTHRPLQKEAFWSIFLGKALWGGPGQNLEKKAPIIGYF